MKKPCLKLVEELNFTPVKICPCSSFAWKKVLGSEIDNFIQIDKNTNPDVILTYLEIRKKSIEQWQDGIIPECCENCFMYSPFEGNETDKLKQININHKTTCHCKCIYCCLADGGKEENFKTMNEREAYDIKPYLTLIENNFKIDENCSIDIMGGECTEYPDDLKFIIDFAEKYNCKCHFYTNGIIFDENIYNFVQNHTSGMWISLDSGSEKTYKKVKRVNAFKNVTENISKYSEALAKNPDFMIHLKYILLPGINDNISEIKKFFKLAENYGIKSLVLSIDRYWLTENQNKKCPGSVEKAIKYFMQNKDFPEISVNADYGFLWEWWLTKVLNNKRLFPFL